MSARFCPCPPAGVSLGFSPFERWRTRCSAARAGGDTAHLISLEDGVEDQPFFRLRPVESVLECATPLLVCFDCHCPCGGGEGQTKVLVCACIIHTVERMTAPLTFYLKNIRADSLSPPHPRHSFRHIQCSCSTHPRTMGMFDVPFVPGPKAAVTCVFLASEPVVMVAISVGLRAGFPG